MIDLEHKILKWNLQYKKYDLRLYFISFEIFKIHFSKIKIMKK